MTSLALGTAEEVTGTVPVVPAGPSTAKLPPEMMAPLRLEDARLGSSRRLERVDTADLLPSGDSAGIAGGVGSSRVASQSPEVSLGRTGADLELGLFLQRRAVEEALGY